MNKAAKRPDLQLGIWRRGDQACDRPGKTVSLTHLVFLCPPYSESFPTLGGLNRVCSPSTIWKYCTLFIDSCSVWQRVCTRRVNIVIYILYVLNTEYETERNPVTPPMDRQVPDLFRPQLLISLSWFSSQSSMPPDNPEIQAEVSATEGLRLGNEKPTGV